jgi:hypothetical protein
MNHRRIALSAIFATALLVPLATPAFSRPGGGGGHFGGGGGHFGGGGGHFGGGGAHFGGGGMHFGGGGLHFGGAHFGGLHFGGARHFGGVSHFGGLHTARAPTHFAGRAASSRVGELERGERGASERLAGREPLGREGRVPADARAALAPHRMPFAGTGRFAERGAPLHSWQHWRRYAGYYGWAGPLFWPYAYDDIYDDLFWGGPYYYDPFWDYGYDDLYGALFSPFGYQELAGYLPGGGSVPGARVGGSEVQQMCGSDSRDIADWPIERIRQLVQPTVDQQALLDQLADASMKAAQVIKTACTTTAALTPSGRLAAMRTRLEAMIQAVDIIRMPIDQFYDSLNDEQKARFVAAEQSRTTPAANAAPPADCAALNREAQWPQAEIERVIHPTPDQQAKIDALKNAAAQAADIIAKACPAQVPMTPPARLDAIATRVNALIDAVKLVQGPLDDLYASLNDEQKAQFNVIGRSAIVRR